MKCNLRVPNGINYCNVNISGHTVKVLTPTLHKQAGRLSPLQKPLAWGEWACPPSSADGLQALQRPPANADVALGNYRCPPIP